MLVVTEQTGGRLYFNIGICCTRYHRYLKADHDEQWPKSCTQPKLFIVLLKDGCEYTTSKSAQYNTDPLSFQIYNERKRLEERRLTFYIFRTYLPNR
jgi:hypothetical protein